MFTFGGLRVYGTAACKLKVRFPKIRISLPEVNAFYRLSYLEWGIPSPSGVGRGITFSGKNTPIRELRARTLADFTLSNSGEDIRMTEDSITPHRGHFGYHAGALHHLSSRQ